MTLSAWLDSRRPPAPMSLAEWSAGGSDEATVAALTEIGVKALEEAVGAPGRVRRAAFDLLAADAFLTFACERALEEDDPEEALRYVLKEITEST